MRVLFVMSAMMLGAAEGFATLSPALSGACARRPAACTVAGRCTALRMAASPPQGEWISQIDPASGSPYWYNSVTAESTWDDPAAAAAPPEPAAPAQLSSGPRLGKINPQNIYLHNESRIMEVPESQKKNAFPGGRSGLMIMMNPLKPGIKWYEHPPLVVFLGAKVGIVLYALFVGFHNQYAGDFGPFLQIKDGRLDTSLASKEWARLHPTDDQPKKFGAAAKSNAPAKPKAAATTVADAE